MDPTLISAIAGKADVGISILVLLLVVWIFYKLYTEQRAEERRARTEDAARFTATVDKAVDAMQRAIDLARSTK